MDNLIVCQLNIIDLCNKRSPGKGQRAKNEITHIIIEISGYELAAIESAASELLATNAGHFKQRQQGGDRLLRAALATGPPNHQPIRGERDVKREIRRSACWYIAREKKRKRDWCTVRQQQWLEARHNNEEHFDL